MELLGGYLSIVGTVVFLYCVVDSFLARQLVTKQPAVRFVGSPFKLVPRFVLNFFFALSAVDLIERGYRKVSVYLLPKCLRHDW
jgi:hypothetical protein